MNKYKEMKRQHQREVHALPFKFAFTDQKFREMMESWGLDPEKDLDKIYAFGNGGCYYQRKDAVLVRETFKRHEAERNAAIEADRTGCGFIYEMFLAELAAHEYGYTGEYDDALESLGYTWAQVQADERLLRGLEKAAKRIMERS